MKTPDVYQTDYGVMKTRDSWVVIGEFSASDDIEIPQESPFRVELPGLEITDEHIASYKDFMVRGTLVLNQTKVSSGTYGENLISPSQSATSTTSYNCLYTSSHSKNLDVAELFIHAYIEADDFEYKENNNVYWATYWGGIASNLVPYKYRNAAKQLKHRKGKLCYQANSAGVLSVDKTTKLTLYAR